MKAIITQALSVAVLSTVVIGGWYVFIKPEPEPARSPFEVFVEKDEPSTFEEVTESVTPLEVAEASEPEELSEPVNVPGNYEYFDEEGISAEVAEEYRKVSVLPYNPFVQECENQWTTHDGRTEAVYEEVCSPKRKYPEHPYFSYDLESLLEMTKNNKDVLAAAVLSEKFKHDYPPEALALALYSSFTSGKPGQLLEIANTQFRTNGVPQKIKNENMIPRYIFTSVAQKMGHPAADLSFAEYLPTEQLVNLEAQAMAMYFNLKADADAGVPLIGDFSPLIESVREKGALGSRD